MIYYKSTNTTGKAYAFLRSKAPKDILPAVIQDAREMYNVPNQLELTITNGPKNFKGDEKLSPYVSRAVEDKMGYVLEARCENQTNEQTANELKALLEGVYVGSKKVDQNYAAFVVHQDNQSKYITEEHSSFLRVRD